MNYSVTVTLGPASSSPEGWRDLMDAGATAFRLNTSHLSLAALAGWLERLDGFQASRTAPVPLVLDLQGSKWRIGEIEPLTLRAGEMIRLVYGQTAERSGEIPVPHRDFFDAAGQSSGEISLNDARVRLRLRRSGADWVDAVVEQGGELSAHKGITYTESNYRSEALSEKDRQIVEQTRSRAGIRFAVSYVRDGAEMARYREWMGSGTHLIAKIERGPAVEDAMRIASYCDEIWLCRGDLGAELGLPGMARAAHNFAHLIPALTALGKPVVLAGQVLEHLTAHPTPTRAEICNLYDALQSGYTGIVLSDETAVGANPVEACQSAAMFLDAPPESSWPVSW